MSHTIRIRSLVFLVGLFLTSFAFSVSTAHTDGGVHAFKEVQAIVTDADSMPPAKSGMMITVQDGHGQRVTYKEGVDPAGVISYRKIPNRFGLIRIGVNNFKQAWAEGDEITISISYRDPDHNSYETATVETILNSGLDDMGPDEDYSLNIQLETDTEPVNQDS